MLVDFFPKLYQPIVAKDKDVEKMVEDSIKREEDDDEKSAEPSSNLVLKKLLVS